MYGLAHGLDPNTDLSFIVGQRMIQACFGRHDLILNFEETEPVSLLITSGVGFRGQDGLWTRFEQFNEVAASHLGPIGHACCFRRHSGKGNAPDLV